MRTVPQQSRADRGFTLIELLIVIAVIAVIAAIAIPNLLAARLSANEAAAIATLKNISSAQAQCRSTGMIDANTNGAGEYGYFAELAGSRQVRSDEAGGATSPPFAPAVLSTAFGTVINSCVIRSGYVYQMWLPSSAGVGIPENAAGGSSGCSIDAGKAETMWCCYAWPSVYGNSGKRAFFTNNSGDILMSRNQATRYSGLAGGPAFASAFRAGTSGLFDDPVAANVTGIDSERWTAVN
jgi:prepilin-type N-terminal cleavage/methylation domain-containing protein